MVGQSGQDVRDLFPLCLIFRKCNILLRMKILMIPRSHQYARELKRYLQQAKVRVVSLQPFHYAAPINIIKLILCRISGYKIIHVHWLYSFPFGCIMKAFCFFCRFLKIKIVWEMHNIVPHDGNDAERALYIGRYLSRKTFASSFVLIPSNRISLTSRSGSTPNNGTHKNRTCSPQWP